MMISLTLLAALVSTAGANGSGSLPAKLQTTREDLPHTKTHLRISLELLTLYFFAIVALVSSVVGVLCVVQMIQMMSKTPR